ncbi:M3 family oligoendopeptidase [Roseomonas eburnea]|uniref:M3 family oligoendopeptidase n=1 Tax=Neoroseomonas eburnea TaxID=1346889 RepID=A0A9X9XCN1_9PROT|nr:M3 family oligoendopeptidase [Neoroseomonas eburnea]MBR0681467.1 M3 family oligoendopeptidase [Neoroseomonas eburnea]
MTLRFAEIAAPRPDRESLAAAHAAIDARLDAGDRAGALAMWDAARRSYETWSALVHLKFAQDTTDQAAVADREYADALAPEAATHETALKRRLLADGDRAGLEALAGRHAVALWETDITAFDPAIAAETEEESRLCARYTALLAGARVSVRGQEVNLAGLTPFAEDPDRDIRHEAEAARWSFFAANGEELDSIYDQLVHLRSGMARKLGDAGFTPLAYRRMRRLDYGPADVARYREAVARHVTPLVARILEQRRATHGWDRLHYWDEALIDPAGNPKPAGDHDTLVMAAQEMFARMDARMSDFYAMMREGGFLDLKNRPGKAGGGFCTAFPTTGAPFIFANFNGTHNDIGVFTHEMGHAFQCWESRHQPGVDYLWPTMEAAEIHSMGLEYLTHPHMGLLVEDGAAERYRHMHLISALAFLPYGVCVDHFQHEVYARPDATPAERHAIWQRLERLYMPWSDYGDLAHAAKGGRWQAKQHIYNSPFYYIDYTLALCCALQFWLWARRDAAGALDAYVALCGRGGSMPFQGLVASAGLTSPFSPGALEAAVAEAASVLGV